MKKLPEPPKPDFWIVAAEVGVSIGLEADRMWINGHGFRSSIRISDVKTPLEMAIRVWLAVLKAEAVMQRRKEEKT